MVYAKLIIRPAPDELASAIRDEKCNEANKEDEEKAPTRAGAICRRKLRERISWCSGVDLVELRTV